MSEFVKVHRDGGALVVTLARVEKKNALTAAMYSRMIAAMAEAEADDAIGALVWYGEGGVFTAGNDIADFLAASKKSESFRALDFIRALAGFGKPMIAAVDGLAIGVGATLLFHCDLVYASPAAQFRMPFIDLALVPEAGVSLLAPRLAGMGKAVEWLMLGEAFNATQARQCGLVNAVEPASSLLAFAVEKARRLAAKPRGALLATRRLLRGDTAEILARIDMEAREFAQRMGSPEARQVFAAFLNKSKSPGTT